MRFSVNIPCLFGKKPLRKALLAMKELGYDSFELWSLREDKIEEIRQALRETGVKLTAFCPDFFVLNDAARRDEYKDALTIAIQRAQLLNCPALITQVGSSTSAPRSMQHDAIVQGLRKMAPLLEAADITLLVEPLNDVKDHKGYYLTDSNEGFDIIREVASPKVRLLFDIYHQLHMGEDVVRRITDNIDLIGHFHVAGYPDRDDRIFENYDYSSVFAVIEQSKTAAPVGLELFCSEERSVALLKRLQEYKSPV